MRSLLPKQPFLCITSSYIWAPKCVSQNKDIIDKFDRNNHSSVKNLSLGTGRIGTPVWFVPFIWTSRVCWVTALKPVKCSIFRRDANLIIWLLKWKLKYPEQIRKLPFIANKLDCLNTTFYLLYKAILPNSLRLRQVKHLVAYILETCTSIKCYRLTSKCVPTQSNKPSSAVLGSNPKHTI